MDLFNYQLKKTKIYTKEQALADEIYSYFGKQLRFVIIMKFIKTKGYRFIYEACNEIRQSNPQNRLKLFMWKVGQVKIVDIKKEAILTREASFSVSGIDTNNSL